MRAQGLERMVLDLRELAFLDSMSIELLLRLHSELTATGAELVVVRGPRAVNRIFDLMELDRVLTSSTSPRSSHRPERHAKPREAALARMPWTVGPSSLHAPAHRRLTMPSALPVPMWTSGPPESPQWIGPLTV